MLLQRLCVSLCLAFILGDGLHAARDFRHSIVLDLLNCSYIIYRQSNVLAPPIQTDCSLEELREIFVAYDSRSQALPDELRVYITDPSLGRRCMRIANILGIHVCISPSGYPVEPDDARHYLRPIIRKIDYILNLSSTPVNALSTSRQPGLWDRLLVRFRLNMPNR